MNLLIVSVDFLPHIGGISLMTHHVANAFADLGHDVRLLASNGARIPEEYEARYQLIEDEASSPRVRETPAYASEIARISRLLTKLHDEREIENVLLMHVFYYGWPVMAFCKARSISYSVFIHGFEFRSQTLKQATWHEKIGLKSRAYQDLRASTLAVVRNAQCQFANSTLTCRLLEQAGADNVRVVGCGISRQEIDGLLVDPGLDKDTNYRREKFGAHGAEAILGFLGRVVPSKNVTFLVDLLAHLPERTHLALAGQGELDPVASHAVALGVSHRVHFLGAVSEHEKWEFLRAIDLLCLPSKMLPQGQMEGFGIVLLEASLRGTPVAVSHHGGMRDFVLDHNGIYIDIHHSEKAAGSIAELLEDRERSTRHVLNAQRLIHERLSYERICEAMLREMSR